MDAAYEVFLEVGFEDFKEQAFALQTTEKKSLDPKRIKEYLQIVFKESGVGMCQEVMKYVFLVLGKYLQMMVAYNINKDEPDTNRVTKLFEQFSQKYSKLTDKDNDNDRDKYISRTPSESDPRDL